MKNRLTNGLIAGIAGGIAMNLYSFIDYYLIHGTTFMFLDWAAVMLYGERTHSVWGNVFALITQILFTSFLGIIFAYLVIKIEDRSYVFKGWYFGIACWIMIYAIDILLKLHDMDKIPIKTAVSNFIGSSIFGIILGYVLWRLDLNTMPSPVNKRERGQK